MEWNLVSFCGKLRNKLLLCPFHKATVVYWFGSKTASFVWECPQESVYLWNTTTEKLVLGSHIRILLAILMFIVAKCKSLPLVPVMEAYFYNFDLKDGGSPHLLLRQGFTESLHKRSGRWRYLRSQRTTAKADFTVCLRMTCVTSHLSREGITARYCSVDKSTLLATLNRVGHKVKINILILIRKELKWFLVQ